MLDLNTLYEFAIKDVKARPGIIDRTFNLKTSSAEGYTVEGWTGKSRSQQEQLLQSWRLEAANQAVAEGVGQGKYGRPARKGGKPSRARRTINRGKQLWETKGEESFEYKNYLKQHAELADSIRAAIRGEGACLTTGRESGNATSTPEVGTSTSGADTISIVSGSQTKSAVRNSWLPTTNSWKRCYHCNSRVIQSCGDVIYCYRCYGEARVVSTDA
jgi:hypothetical protein